MDNENEIKVKVKTSDQKARDDRGSTWKILITQLTEDISG